MTNEEYDKAFRDFYEAVAHDSQWSFIAQPRYDRLGFWGYCFDAAVRGSDGGSRHESKGTGLAKVFLLGRESATGTKIITRPTFDFN